MGSGVTAVAIESLAPLLFANKRFHEAEPLFRRSLEIWTHALALVRVAKENYKDAEPLFKRALAALDVPYNRSSGQLGELLADYAAVLRQLGRPAEAAKLEARRRALQGAVAALPARGDQ